MPNLILIGKTPPPIGGVTIHVNRLIEHLDESSIDFDFIELCFSNLFQILKTSLKYKVIHLHTSHVWLRFFFSIYSVLNGKKLILTFHGNLGRYNHFYNWIDNLSVRLANIPIALNQQSFDKAILINENVRLVPAFIPPKEVELDIDSLISSEIQKLNYKYKKVYCTNAFDVTFDKDHNEIYGVSELVKLFSSLKKVGLVISDPSGNYKKYLNKENIFVSDNIKIFNFNHSFFYVLKNTDGFIRATTTDGDSLSVKEALYLGKSVYCTDCVDRPKGVILFETKNYLQLKKLLSREDRSKSINQNIYIENGFDTIREIYLELI